MNSNCNDDDDDILSAAASPAITTTSLLQTILITVLATSIFLFTKSSYDRLRLRTSRATVVIIGAGPSGLFSAWIVAQTAKASRIIVYEERSRLDIVRRIKYMSLNIRSVKFLRCIGLELTDNVEGSFQHQCFVTKTGLVLDYMISLIKSKHGSLVDIRTGTKFTRDCLKELDDISERIIAIVCDGSCGRSASLLGLSDEYTQHSCRAYGAVATIERPTTDQLLPSSSSSVILPEIRVHHLTIELTSHSKGSTTCQNDPFPTSFHLKIFGSADQRSMALTVPRCESTIVKTLKVTLEQSVMRNIFQECFNKYRVSCDETPLSDTSAIKQIKFSPRLFEIKLMQRMESAAYIEDANIFVVAEGEATRRVNFDSGMDINLVISGLRSLWSFVEQAVWVDTEKTILKTLSDKIKHGQAVTQDFVKNGLKEVMYT